MTTNESDSLNPADEAGIETLIRTRFEDTVGSLDLDVGSLVGVGTARGRRLRRRRRLQGVGAAASIAVIAAAGVVGLQSGVFDNSSPEVKQTPVQQLVPSSSRAQAAALIDLLPAGLSPTRWLGSPPSQKTIGSTANGTRWNGSITSISVDAQRYVGQTITVGCKGRSASPPNSETCHIFQLADGGSARLDVNIQDLGGAHPQELLNLLVFRPGVAISLMVEIGDVTASQTTAIAETAVRAAHDPALGLTTYPRFIKAAALVPRWMPG